LYARMDGSTNTTCDYFNFTQDDDEMKKQMCNKVPDTPVRPRLEALHMANVLHAGCAKNSSGPLSCIFFPESCLDGVLNGECPRSKLFATTSNRNYEPLARAPSSVHIELVGPDLNDRKKLKSFLGFITDNAEVISRGMTGSSLSFYGKYKTRCTTVRVILRESVFSMFVEVSCTYFTLVHLSRSTHSPPPPLSFPPAMKPGEGLKGYYSHEVRWQVNAEHGRGGRRVCVLIYVCAREVRRGA
jgi:hypothetical protein